KSELSTRWTQFLVGIRQGKLVQKYNTLVKNSLYVTSLEAREDYNQRNKLASFKYINLEYASVPDAEVKLTDEDYANYYNENKFKFKNEEDSRSFEYVVFDANPSKEDSTTTKAQVGKLVAELRASSNDSLFVSINSDTKTPVTYMRKGSFDPALDSLIFNSSNGQVVGPVFENGSYKFAKVIDVKFSPDSVKARHILINPTTEGGLDKALAKADSIKNLILKGASFAELATKFGTDASKDKGGELGTFARGSMIPAFEEAVFNGKAGDLKVLTTQYGVHVIKIDAQIGSSKVAKVALVDKALASSTKTQQEAYGKATSFLSEATNAKSFDDQAQKSGYRKLVAEDVEANQSSVPGLENPRTLIKWVYTADVNDISDKVFEVENKYVVAKVTAITPKGNLSLEKVKKQIEPMVRNQVKAEKLLDMAKKALEGSSTIEQVAQKLKKPVVPVQNIVFANPIIPGIAQENSVVGAVFGSQPKKLSKAIQGENGVYIYVVDNFTNPAPLTNAYKQKEQIVQGLIQRAGSETFKVLKDKAEIKDNRVKFF
ncbi:MAG: PpiC-type peptidyl-prolyl cis-trans isomerase, partial [Daejeonella sp.]|nr:PpiC-type peptidyl-prolyl cis-trans isomerase [Daejeonella sp.]